MGVADLASARQMTESAYEAERDALRAKYGDTASEHTGIFDQELSRLFNRSGWSQPGVQGSTGITD